MPLITIPQDATRPASSLSNRPSSRISQRPVSRLSQLSVVKQSRLAPLVRTLVKQITGAEEESNPGDFQEALGIAVRHIDSLKQSATAELSHIDAQIKGHITKARINVHDVLADAIHNTYSTLKKCMIQPSTFGAAIKTSTIPTIVEFLLHLSSSPDKPTLAYALYISQRTDPEQSKVESTWLKILNEEPFEGQHWEGAYGLPSGSIVKTWDSENSETDLSFEESDDCKYQADTSSGSDDDPNEIKSRPIPDSLAHKIPSLSNKALENRFTVQKISSLQYWNGMRPQSSQDPQFNLNRPWTLGPISDRILKSPVTLERALIYIEEIHAIREVLFLLQGLPSVLFNQDNDTVTIVPHWRVSHLTHTAQTSILNVFASSVTVMKYLRSLPSEIILSERSPTFQAFMAGVARQLQKFDTWCSDLETQIGSDSPLPEGSDMEATSLLQFRHQLEKRISHIFDDLSRVKHMWESRPATTKFPGQIINALWQCLKLRQTFQDQVTIQALWEVLKTTVEPLWLNLGQWLKNGIPIDLGLEEGESKLIPTWNVGECFIRINPLIDAAASDFWEAKYTLQRNPAHAEMVENPVPSFLVDIANDILAAGKAVGLIRAMNLSHLLKSDWFESWGTFEAATSAILNQEIDVHIQQTVFNILMTPCRTAQNILSRVLIDESHLWKHLGNMEAICLMTRGDVMGQFSERLFRKMDSSHYAWHDYHFVNAAFRDITKMDRSINPSLVTFSYKTNRDRKLDRTIAAIDGLTVEYVVPFPLVYLFGSESSASYSSLFCFLLQIQRSKFVLDQISLNKVNTQFSKERPFLTTFYLIRWKLSSFINVNKMHVIDVSIQQFHSSLLSATSLDEMINLHRMHLKRLLHCVFLQENVRDSTCFEFATECVYKTSALHRAILSILNLSLRLNDCLGSHKANDYDFSRSSAPLKASLARRSNLRQRHQRVDVIGFTEAMPAVESSDSDESEGEPDSEGFEISVLAKEETDGLEALNQINKELDSLTSFVRRGVQILASGVTDASDAFGILAFLLEGET
ncbi:hypothetical protein Clacol_001563 [Clathrus columnatus]|uniref:Spindle pole body component n=1 Tax=Clathrus columnatus TaxID=1419009 RepID=A0AAV5A2W7_9AGAM|nr:hypothetical protein Clacol_001563 [Clathrus columnatus]